MSRAGEGRRGGEAAQTRQVPDPGQGAARCPRLSRVPTHVALIMDGNGRWANARGLARTEGHRAGEIALMDTVAGALEAGVRYLSVYAFSTENWRRSPSEVRFLLGYSRQVLRGRRDQLNRWGVRVRWAGRPQRLWKSVLSELAEAERLTRDNNRLDLIMCLNYGGRAELVDAARALAQQAAAGQLVPARINERALAAQLYQPQVPDVDLLIRSSGEQRLSNFLLWQAAYAELSFIPEAWPEVDRTVLWRELMAYGTRERRFGAASEQVSVPSVRTD